MPKGKGYGGKMGKKMGGGKKMSGGQGGSMVGRNKATKHSVKYGPRKTSRGKTA